MEAANIGAREADVAPAADPTGGRMAGWTPADPGPLGLAAFAGTTFMLSLINAGLVGTQKVPRRRSVADGGRAGARLRRYRPAPGRDLGVPHRQHVRRGGVLLLWGVLDLVLLRRPVRGQERRRPRCSAGSGCTCGCGASSPPTCSSRRCGRPARWRWCSCCWRSRIFILGIGNSSLAGADAVTNGTIKLGGYIGIATAIAAWYASFAAVVNSTFGRVMMPVVPLRR